MENLSTSDAEPIQLVTERIDFSTEESLSNVSILLLIMGVISAGILFFSLGIVNTPSIYGTSSSSEFSGTGIVLSIGVLMSSIATYFFLQVVGNISRSLKILVENN
ncbi:hypothetical protein [Dyadobacter crusticola]|uniref:hypothetical protein n=1 Tax=Dyadobacter crusticola TaxID=292407 RepID=UPI0012FADF36|nr:hypothetical protein [Dyadobacter crusticola]